MNERIKYSLVFGILGAVFFIPLLGGVHLFDWDEINFAEMAREMIETGDYLSLTINYEPFWQKPPFFIWLQALSMNVFGVGEFAARFPNAVCGILTLILLFNLGKTLYHTRFGILWAGSYFGSILPFLYFKSGIIDPWFNFFIFSGIYLFVRFVWKKDGIFGNSKGISPLFLLLSSGIVIGLGILTKGPVAYLIPVLCMAVYWVFQRFRFFISPVQFLLFSLGTTIVTLSWFGIETYYHGPWFAKAFTLYQIELLSTHSAGHAGFPGYHFVVLLFGVFPASVFSVLSFFRAGQKEAPHLKDFRLWMKILFWVVIILFSIVQSKIVHYSSLCYFPISFLAAWVLNDWLDNKQKIPGWTWALLGGIGGLFILITLTLPVAGNHIDWIKPLFSNDPFAMANLDAQVEWSYWGLIPGLVLLSSIIIFFALKMKGQKGRALGTLYSGTAIFVFSGLVFFINNIEAITQRAAIEFFESKKDENAYFMTYGYKSFSHYFYGRVRPPEKGELMPEEDELFRGSLSRPVYLSSRIHKAEALKETFGLEELYRKNGFVFFRRSNDSVKQKKSNSNN